MPTPHSLLIAATLALATAAITAGPALAGGSITDGNATFTITTGAGVSIGDADFTADPAAPDVLFQWQWWFRVDSSNPAQSREFRFPAPTTEVYSGATATLTWTGLGPPDGRFDAVLGVTINDGAVATAADVSFTLEITDARPSPVSPLDLSIFSYLDPSAAGTPAADSATIVGFPSINGHIMFTDGADFIDFYGVQSDGYAIAPAPTLRNDLDDAAITTFTNTGAPAGPADLAAGHQWIRSIPPGDSVTIRAAVTVNTTLPACSWDLDGDGAVTATDLALLLGLWNNPYSATSLAQLLGAWGAC